MELVEAVLNSRQVSFYWMFVFSSIRFFLGESTSFSERQAMKCCIVIWDSRKHRISYLPFLVLI